MVVLNRADDVQRTAREHLARALPHFLGRLEHDEHIAGRGLSRQQQGGTHRPRRVHVVSARVHHAVVCGGELEAGSLGDRQRVDVASQRDDGCTRVTAAYTCHQAGPGHTANVGDAAVAQRAFEALLRAGLLPREFGVAVQVAPELGEQPAIGGGEPEVAGHRESSAVRTVSDAMRSASTSTPMPGRSSGTRTMPLSMVHSGETMSRAQ
jgi:hypothetical protein